MGQGASPAQRSLGNRNKKPKRDFAFTGRIHEHHDAKTYFDEGIRLLELAQKAGVLSRKQPPAKKRRLLGLVLSNCTWMDGRLTAAYRQPFDLLVKNVIALESKKPAHRARTGFSENWLPGPDSNQRPID